jgi:hypothetical protein
MTMRIAASSSCMPCWSQVSGPTPQALRKHFSGSELILPAAKRSGYSKKKSSRHSVTELSQRVQPLYADQRLQLPLRHMLAKDASMIAAGCRSDSCSSATKRATYGKRAVRAGIDL